MQHTRALTRRRHAPRACASRAVPPHARRAARCAGRRRSGPGHARRRARARAVRGAGSRSDRCARTRRPCRAGRASRGRPPVLRREVPGALDAIVGAVARQEHVRAALALEFVRPGRRRARRRRCPRAGSRGRRRPPAGRRRRRRRARRSRRGRAPCRSPVPPRSGHSPDWPSITSSPAPLSTLTPTRPRECGRGLSRRPRRSLPAPPGLLAGGSREAAGEVDRDALGVAVVGDRAALGARRRPPRRARRRRSACRRPGRRSAGRRGTLSTSLPSPPAALTPAVPYALVSVSSPSPSSASTYSSPRGGQIVVCASRATHGAAAVIPAGSCRRIPPPSGSGRAPADSARREPP